MGEIRSLSFHDTCIVVVAPPAPNIRKEKPSQMANGDVIIGMDNLLDVSVLNLAIEAKELAWVWLDPDPRPAPRSESEHVVKNYDGFAKLAFKESNPCYSCGAPCSKKCTRCRAIFYCSRFNRYRIMYQNIPYHALMTHIRYGTLYRFMVCF